jgi:hypothetical protein
MGCDIQLHIEMKTAKGKWQELDILECLLPTDRNYDVFSFLAGVRGGIGDECHFEGRGIPVDSSIDKEKWCNDVHSCTYAYLDELLRAPWKKAKLDDCYFYIFCAYVLPRAVSFTGTFSDEDERNIRIVMAFDS